MIWDGASAVFVPLLSWLFGLLPEAGEVSIPGLSRFAEMIAEMDTLVPILPVLALAGTVLSAVVVFVLVRLVLVVVNIVWW